MEKIVRAIEHIQLIPGAQVDRSFRQGVEAVLSQLQPWNTDVSYAEELIAAMQDRLRALQSCVKPCQLPEDYIFFLEFYGGLIINGPSHRLMVDGIGPMTMTWYGRLVGEEMIYDHGLLGIGHLSLFEKRQPAIYFFLDLAGTVDRYAVIGIHYRTALVSILRSLPNYPRRWIKVADSFTDWLEKLAATGGLFGYS